MAWPNSLLTSYTAGTTPAIKAFDLNAIQGAINDLVNGDISMLAGFFDGTGGLPVIPTPGTVTVTALLAGTASPTTPLLHGQIARDSAYIGWADIAANGQMTVGTNVFAEPGLVGGVNHPVAGEYFVQFHIASAGFIGGAALATSQDVTGGRVAAQYTALGGKATARIVTRDAAGAQADGAFSVGLLAG